MSFVGRLSGNAQCLSDLLPGPPFVNRTFHCLAFHAVGQPAEADDRRDRRSRVVRGGCHASTVASSFSFVNLR